VLAFCVAATLVTGVVFGLAPAWSAVRSELAVGLPGRAVAGGGRRRPFGLRQGLVAAQVAFSLVGLAVAGLFLASLANARRIDPGFAVDKLLVASFDAGAQGYGEEEARQFQQELVRRVAALPGVEAAATAATPPLSFSFQWRMKIEGAEELTGPEGSYVSLNTVSPGYFETLGVPLVEGRLFTPEDARDGRPVVVVNRTLAERFWPGQSALGKQMRWAIPDAVPFEVVAVVADVKYASLGEPPTPYFYRPSTQEPLTAATLLVRTALPPAALLEPVQREIHALDAALPVVDARPVGDLLEEALWAPLLAVRLLGAFGLLALLLAATGLYAVLAESVQGRRREIGVRLALGARRDQVLGMVLREGMVQVGLGAALGIVLIAAGSRLLAVLLYGIEGPELRVLAPAVALLAAAALAACLVPAARATRVDAATVLRQG
jgi:putative ABC transport system permease protein